MFESITHTFSRSRCLLDAMSPVGIVTTVRDKTSRNLIIVVMLYTSVSQGYSGKHLQVQSNVVHAGNVMVCKNVL